MVVDDKGMALDPQPEYVEEGKSVMIAAMSVDKDGKAMAAGENLKVMLEPTGTPTRATTGSQARRWRSAAART